MAQAGVVGVKPLSEHYLIPELIASLRWRLGTVFLLVTVSAKRMSLLVHEECCRFLHGNDWGGASTNPCNPPYGRI